MGGQTARAPTLCLQDPFKAPYGWAAWGLGGLVLSPLVVGATASLVGAGLGFRV